MTEDKDSGLLRVHSKEKFIELENAKIQRTLEVNANHLLLTNGATVATGEAVEELRMTEVFKFLPNIRRHDGSFRRNNWRR